MNITRVRHAVAFVAAVLTLGTAAAADASSAGQGSPRTLAETKRSMDRMSSAILSTTPSAKAAGRSLSEVKRDVGRPATGAPTAGPVSLSGVPLAKAKRQ